MARIDCKSSCTSGMQAAFHIERAWRLLNAAHEVQNLSGAIYRNTLKLAMGSLGEAVLALETRSTNNVRCSNG